LHPHSTFVQKDAWVLGYTEKFDLISSNGLSIYEADDHRVVELYRQFFKALKPNGVLVTSFLTPPPAFGGTEWKMECINREEALLQKILFADILECKWQVFRSESVVRAQLLEAGFLEIEFLYDKAHLFPTVIAKKV
jgi:SAM-dependent methyltransferase